MPYIINVKTVSINLIVLLGEKITFIISYLERKGPRSKGITFLRFRYFITRKLLSPVPVSFLPF